MVTNKLVMEFYGISWQLFGKGTLLYLIMNWMLLKCLNGLPSGTCLDSDDIRWAVSVIP